MSTTESGARPSAESLHELGESATNVADAWAGANDFTSCGLVEWVKRTVGDDRGHAVRAALAASDLVVGLYPAASDAGTQAPKKYIDDMMGTIRQWASNPSDNNKATVRSALDVSRQVHAWQTPTDIPHFWILEAVDHASLAVWAGERLSYIVPIDFATSAARSVACVLHALKAAGGDESSAVAKVVDAVVGAAS